ncbi:MAG: hypothetical protein LKM30_07820 [Bacilli bacterium]|jgi:hypothetical protein|nr:hypothetical protein [Bacilli bacterium]
MGNKTNHDANRNPEDLVRYSELVAALEKVFNAGMLNKAEYDLMKAKFMSDYKVSSDWAVGRDFHCDFSSKKGGQIRL